MHSIIESKIANLRELCDKHRVYRLSLFGSATNDRFVPDSSDLDMLVEFHPMPPSQHADCYFGLMEDLQRLFEMPVDLIERGVHGQLVPANDVRSPDAGAVLVGHEEQNVWASGHWRLHKWPSSAPLDQWARAWPRRLR